MTSLFKPPQINEPRSTGVKNQGVSSYDTRIIQPVSRIVGSAVKPGTQVQFRFRSSSNSWYNPRETKLAVRYKFKFAPQTVGAGTEHQLNPVAGKSIVPTVRFTAMPNHCLFADGGQYQVNSTMIENQPSLYSAAMFNLYTKFDDSSDTSGSNALMSRRKDLHDAKYATRLVGGNERGGFAEISELNNPKQDILMQSFQGDATESGEIEILEPLLGLASQNHGWFVSGADHELTFNISQTMEQDLLHSCHMTYKSLTSANPPVPRLDDFTPYDNLVIGALPADGTLTSNTIYCEISNIELHCAMAGSVPSIPPSIALKYSELQITNRPIRQEIIEESIVIPPSTRMLWICSRQNHHHMRCDAEELGLAGGGIDEVGYADGTADGTAGNLATLPAAFKSLNVEIGGQTIPGNGGYTNMDVTQLRAGRPYTDALSVVGKPSGMRGTTWDFVSWCGKRSTNGRTFPAGATGSVGNFAVADQTMGDQGPMYGMRCLLPPNSLSNVLTVRASMSHRPEDTSKQLLTVICVHDSLWSMQYAPPAELPVSTNKAPIT